METLPYEASQRVLIPGCRLLKRSHYQTVFHGEEGTVWRYWFRSPLGYVLYTGKWLGVNVGDEIDLRGTVKRHERFGTRISRPKIVEKNCEKMLDGFETKH